jgi:hypothetical protein
MINSTQRAPDCRVEANTIKISHLYSPLDENEAISTSFVPFFPENEISAAQKYPQTITLARTMVVEIAASRNITQLEKCAVHASPFT